MELKEAIKIAEEIRDVAAVMDKIQQAVVLDILIQHANQPVQVTDEMVEAGAGAILKKDGKLPIELARWLSRAALQAALNVKGSK
jgi:hypothetical protein